jgi:hypothetical protein
MSTYFRTCVVPFIRAKSVHKANPLHNAKPVYKAKQVDKSKTIVDKSKTIVDKSKQNNLSMVSQYNLPMLSQNHLPIVKQNNLPMVWQPTNHIEKVKVVNSDCLIMMVLFTTNFLSYVTYTN